MTVQAIETRRFDTPDQRLDMQEMSGISILQISDGSTGLHAAFEPGWAWEKDENPLLGSPDTFPMRHNDYFISGNLLVRILDTGAETPIGMGDLVRIPPARRLSGRRRAGRTDPLCPA
ncbi:cupin domain-containing protein [uncultured Jannaschia sp.]|uniref:cupin domain-containing protein n=1 Tax=uncultured Jannaschia sp. TaxID=293347 RepID=UPI002619DEA6|nr:cupin domain-containing protein [uncultured Jannaschia sp.]